ncbi:MAG: hypothetical protein KA408_04055 [Flavobacteriales bacterium]|nr:hypothetical protein [Flavobacteriales bacterium]
MKVKFAMLRTPRWKNSSDVRYVRTVINDGIEQLALEKGRLILPQFGGLPLLYWFDQAFETPNAIGLEITVGETELLAIRKLDKDLEQKVLRLLRGKAKENAQRTTFETRLRIVVVIG